MINFYEQVPSVYPNTSRDFQYLSWLIDIVLNSVKHNVDDLYRLPSTEADPRLTELLALTLGFKAKRNYDQKQLIALVNIIPSILKHKGTKEAVAMAAKALIIASDTVGDFDEDKGIQIKNNVLEVNFPTELVDTTLFIDLLPYILPAGLTCRIVRKPQTSKSYTTEIGYEDRAVAAWHIDASWDSDKATFTGLAGLFEPGKDEQDPNFTNYNNSSVADLNAGLLSNTIIPDLMNLNIKEGEE